MLSTVVLCICIYVLCSLIPARKNIRKSEKKKVKTNEAVLTDGQ